MNEANKKRLRDAFEYAINNSPDADKAIDGIFMNDKTPATLRKMFTAQANDPEVHKIIQNAIDAGKVTMDDVVEQIRNTKSLRPSK